MAKCFITHGHSQQYPGAQGFVAEQTRNEEIVNALKKYIDFTEVPDTGGSTANNELIAQIAWINARASAEDTLIAVHCNAGGGHGTEVWYYGGDASSKAEGEKFAGIISSETGLPNRGAKPDTDSRYKRFGIVRDTKPWSWLVECGFVDNQEDMNVSPDTYARGIAKYLETRGFALKGQAPAPTPVTERDAIQFEGDTKVYFWAQNQDIAKKWYGDDWGSVVRVIYPTIKEVIKEVPTTIYVDKPVPYEVDSAATLKELSDLKEKILSLEQENKTLKSSCPQTTIENKPKTLDNKGIWQVIINFLKGVK